MPVLTNFNITQSRLVVSIIAILATFLSSPAAFAQSTKYISDVFEVTMRSGTSTANSIVKILRSGESVLVLEEDLASQYSLVESSDGKKGYVLSRFLDDIPSARERLAELQIISDQQKQINSELRAEIEQLKSIIDKEKTDNEALKNTLLASENELEKVRLASENTLNILEDNNRLKTIVATLREEKKALTDENSALKDSTEIDWFMRGAIFFLVAFLLGIIVTRIRWRKQDSWGSY